MILLAYVSAASVGADIAADVQPMVRSSCIDCHAADSETGLNLEGLDFDLADQATFKRWERVFDRVASGEMPPPEAGQPDQDQKRRALAALRSSLRAASLKRQERIGRVPARRLTKVEYGYTLHDLLQVSGTVTNAIPEEVESGTFDTVGANQRFSAVHMQSYLRSADDVLDKAIRLGRKPYMTQEFDLEGNAFLNSFHHKPLQQGGSISRRIDDGVALFRDVDYLLRSDIFGLQVREEGEYRISSELQAYQTNKPVTVKLLRKELSGSTTLLQSLDLNPGNPQTIETMAHLKPGDAFYVTFVDDGNAVFAAIAAAGGSKKYKGRGLAVLSQSVAGPLTDSWPPASTTNLFSGIDVKGTKFGYTPRLTKPVARHVADIVRSFAVRAFRRPVSDKELAEFLTLAEPAIAEKRDFTDVVRVPLRSILSSPQFLMFSGEPGPLDDYSLASRLSYFLWKSLPDEELLELAAREQLTDEGQLATQIDRMLDDPRSRRFIDDFLGQWLLLNKVNATTPDEKLYPEYDELLAAAIIEEPRLFFVELLEKNLSLSNLIDSDFTFANRRLAMHYGLKNIQGQDFRRVTLPEDSPRGGILTQAAILKTSANGTTTSPVTRGNFVLTSILGTPPSPPPPSVGSIEPDTRGKTTIREILAAHRDVETCNKCHREIDPPGFALESFDPIGTYRTHYRIIGKPAGLAAFLSPGRSWKKGLPVDASGVTAVGGRFDGIAAFKKLLLKQKEQIAKNFVSQLVVYATGGEIQFADRDDVDAILNQTRPHGFRLRDIVHAVVQSRLFRNK